MQTRVTEMLGIQIPIVQAPMGFIARAQLASAVSNAGGMGIIETSSGRIDDVLVEMAKMAKLTDRPWGVNIAQRFVRDPLLVDKVIGAGVRFVTTSAGDPAAIVPTLKAAGITVFHVVPTLRTAFKAVAAGVDGLIVEGIEGGGFKNPDGASTMVLLPLIASRVDIPVIAAGGICDGRSMAAAFVLGAEGVQMGTRMVSALESPVHDNWKQAIVAGAETDTVIVNRNNRPVMRVLRTERSATAEQSGMAAALEVDALLDLYFGGSLESGFANCGQVMGRIDDVLPVAQILRESWADCQQILGSWAERVTPAK
jgi:enoyl-[acyl-carrier protein] reductase II